MEWREAGRGYEIFSFSSSGPSRVDVPVPSPSVPYLGNKTLYVRVPNKIISRRSKRILAVGRGGNPRKEGDGGYAGFAFLGDTYGYGDVEREMEDTRRGYVRDGEPASLSDVV